MPSIISSIGTERPTLASACVFSSACSINEIHGQIALQAVPPNPWRNRRSKASRGATAAGRVTSRVARQAPAGQPRRRRQRRSAPSRRAARQVGLRIRRRQGARAAASMRNLLGGKGADLAEMAQSRPAGAARLHHHHRGLHLFLRARQNLSEGPEAAGRGRARRGRHASPARSSATPTIRCWSRCAPARARRCPA